MFASTFIFTAIAAFTSLTAARTLASSEAFQVSNIFVNGTTSGNTTITFTVYDPEPLANQTAICTGDWGTYTEDYPKESYKRCGNSSFAWRMESYNDFIALQLGIEHEFTDPSVGDYPYDQVITFGKGTVTADVMRCRQMSVFQRTECWQPRSKSITAPIYALTA